jgi:hypothetical protein
MIPDVDWSPKASEVAQKDSNVDIVVVVVKVAFESK